jgi:hypothetical protein
VLGVITAPLLLAGVVVLGEGREGCPSAGAVSARLEELLEDDGSGPPDALIFDGAAGALRVRLMSAEGSVREEKTLDLRGSCEELADAVATLGVAWRSRLKSDEVPPPVLIVNEAPLPPPAPAAPLVLPVRPGLLEPADFELSVGFQTASGVERWAPGLLLGAQLPVSGRYNVGLTLDLSAPRTAFDGASRRWTWVQLRLVAGPSVRSVTPSLYIDGQLGLAAGMDVALNSGTPGSPYHRASPALVTGARWTYRKGRGMPWFGVTFTLNLDPELDSPIISTNIASERWLLGLALGGTLGFDAGH